MEEKYVSTTEILKATRISASNISRRSKKEQWKTKEGSSKGKTTLFLFDSLPEDIKSLFKLEITESKPIPIEKPAQDSKEQDKDKDQKQSDNDEKEIRKKEISEIIKKIEAKSIIVMGKVGIGKTYVLERAAQILAKESIVIHFKEPPTAKTVLLNITIAAEVQFGKSKEDAIENLKSHKGKNIVLCIDQLERMTPSTIEVLDSLLTNFNWFRFMGAGHLGNKKRYNSTWMKATGYMLKPLSRQDSVKLIDKLWPDGDGTSKKIIVDESKGIPGNIQRIAIEARQGIMPHEEQRYIDFTPMIMIIATLGLAIRVIGYGYSSTDTYIMGGVIATVFTGGFWIYRGYVSGWWGTKNQKKRF